MTAILGSQAIVIGAGMGGLAAAAALSPYFSKVQVIDRDELPADASPRMGAGQGAHAHQLLKGGELSLERLAPGIRDAFLAAGAQEVRIGVDFAVYDHGGPLPGCDPGFSIVCLSRPAYEKTLREQVEKLGNVDFRDQTAVAGPLIEDGRCAGVELEDGETVRADLTIDASGMNAPMISRLVEAKEADFDTEELRVNVSYTSAIFKKPDAYKGEKQVFYVTPAPPSTQFAIIAPIENERWVVSLGMRGRTTVPRDLEGYLAFARDLPVSGIYERLAGAELESPIKTHLKPFVTRRLLGEARRWPEGLLAIGDAMTSFNPTFGQGMSVAALQAAALSDLLAARAESGGGLDGLPRSYFPQAQKIAEIAWRLAVSTDFAYPETEGERPPDFARARAMQMVMRRFTEVDDEFLNLRMRMTHLIDDGRSAREGPLAERIQAFAAQAMQAAEPAE
jgi:flavin-dependent dehydrogenase